MGDFKAAPPSQSGAPRTSPDGSGSEPVIEHITSTANPAIKAIKALEMKKARDRDGLYLAEGLRHVTEGIAAGRRLTTLVYRTEDGPPRPILRAAMRACARDGGRCLEVPEKVLSKLSHRDNPQTVLGVFEQAWAADDAWLASTAQLWIGLETVRDPGNLGTILRTADALGIDGVLLIGSCCDPYATECVRASMGSIARIPPAKISQERFAALRPTFPGQIVGTHLAGSVDFRSLSYDRPPTLLLMGNEQKGLSEAVAILCDHLVRIPMAQRPDGGGADSLNLSVATAIAAYQILGPRLSDSD
ncbi:MAG: TrmH family RNA methyltransferase [Rhodospirillaceae bacterium]